MEIPKSAAELPTIIANRFMVIAGKECVRVMIGEQVAPGLEPTYHLAFMMAHSDARWLADVLNKQILEAETKL